MPPGWGFDSAQFQQRMKDLEGKIDDNIAQLVKNERDFYVAVAAGFIPGYSLVHKFGRNLAVGTSFVPVSIGGIYRTKQVGAATTLRIKSGGNANDTAAGSGAQEVTLIGINAAGNEVSEAVATAGASASSATTNSFIRLYRAYVSASGTYATASAGSHSADITIEDGGGTEDWATITTDSSSFPRAQSEIGYYTIPTGYTGYLLSASAFTDSTKTTTLLFFQRQGVLDTAAPYEAMRLLFEERVEGGESTVDIKSPIRIDGPADVGYLAKVNTGTAEVDVDFELLLIDNGVVSA